MNDGEYDSTKDIMSYNNHSGMKQHDIQSNMSTYNTTTTTTGIGITQNDIRLKTMTNAGRSSSMSQQDMKDMTSSNDGMDIGGELDVVEPICINTATTITSTPQSTATTTTTNNNNTPHHYYRGDIDGLRAIAVVAVIVYHMNEAWLPGGFVGVDVFFVISGFVVSGSLHRRQSGNGKSENFFSNFYARRIRRLMPSLVLAVLFAAIFMRASETRIDGPLLEYFRTGVYALIGGSNMYLGVIFTRLEDTDDKPDSVAGYFVDWETTNAHNLDENPLMHTWSLGVEEQFYFVFPVMFHLVYNTHRTLHPLYVWTTICAASFTVCWILSVFEQTWAFYLMPSRLWQLMVGILVYDVLHVSKVFELTLKWARVLDVVALVSLAIALVITNPKDGHFPLPWSLLATGGTACFLVAGEFKEFTESMLPPFTSCLRHRYMAYIGRISYPLYLWHWILLVIFRWWDLDSGGWSVLAVVCSTVLSVASYHGPERVFRLWKPQHLLHVFAVGAVAVGCSILIVIMLSMERSTNSQTFQLIPCGGGGGSGGAGINCNGTTTYQYPSCTVALSGRDWADSQIGFASVPRRSCACSTCANVNAVHFPNRSSTAWSGPCLTRVAVAEQPEISHASMSYARHHCTEFTGRHINPAHVNWCLTPPRKCPNTSRAIFLLGDSHAASYVVAVQSAIANTSVELVFATVGHMCGFNSYAFNEAFKGIMGGIWPRCQQMLNLMWSNLHKNVRPNDLVLTITANWKYPMSQLSSLSDRYDLEHLEAVRQLVVGRNASLVILDDSPKLPTFGWNCKTPQTRHLCEVAKQSLSHYATAANQFKNFVLHRSGAHFMEIFDAFCANNVCGSYIPGTDTIAIGDTDHWTFEGALYVAPFLSCFLSDTFANLCVP